MQEKHVFEYGIVRLVPQVERGECINVGLILFCKRKRFLGMKYHLNKERLEAFCPDLNLSEVEQYLKSWKEITIGKQFPDYIAKLDAAERFRWLTATKSTILQSSKVHPGLCSDPQAELDKLFGKYVL
ncbi:MAG: DUF3037 domain-containing protein [Bacteroidia bacterium]|nr:DUF3037 domain-containing protein [Bacteroidia bacterium]